MIYKNNILNIISSFFFIFNFSISCMEQGSTGDRKIGVEIETTAIKVSLKENIYSGFAIANSDGTTLWSVEQDTTDMVGVAEFAYNIEFKTHGGFKSKIEFLKNLKSMTSVLGDIYIKSEKQYNIHINRLKNIIKKNNGEEYVIKKLYEKQGVFKVKKNSGKYHVRPQITYQLPLCEIFNVFQRMVELGSRQVEIFLRPLNNSAFTKYEFPTITPEMSVVEQNKYKLFGILNFFHDNFSASLMLSNTTVTNNVKGFSYLFLCYWYNIFNDNKLPTTREPGLKPFLPIMSRIPLSQVYDNALTNNEKQQFQSLFNDIVLQHGSTYKIREYKKYDGNSSSCTHTIVDWYKSIIGEENNRKLSSKKINDKEIKCEVDILSPPPDLPENYGMGFYHWDSTRSPLIEVRAYATILYEKTDDIKIDNIENFVTKEANWFFDK